MTYEYFYMVDNDQKADVGWKSQKDVDEQVFRLQMNPAKSRNMYIPLFSRGGGTRRFGRSWEGFVGFEDDFWKFSALVNHFISMYSQVIRLG
jgi:hypothetical protein